MDVGEGSIVTQHLHVDGPDQELSEFLLPQVALEEFGLEQLRLGGDDFVFLLLGAGLADGLD